MIRILHDASATSIVEMDAEEGMVLEQMRHCMLQDTPYERSSYLYVFRNFDTRENIKIHHYLSNLYY